MRWTRIVFVVLAGLTACAADAARPVVGGLGALYPWPEDPTNLVHNGSFEEVDTTGQPLHWRVGEPAHWGLEAPASHHGRWSLRLHGSHRAHHTPNARQALKLPPGWYSLQGWLKAVEAGTNNPGAGGRISLRGTGTAGPVVRGTTDWILVKQRSLAIGDKVSPELRLEAYRKPDGDIFFDEVAVHRHIPPMLEGFLLYPNYRGLLFTDRSQELRLHVTMRPEEAGLKLADVRIRLVLATPEGQVVARRDMRPNRTTLILTLDATETPLGRYRLHVQALRAASEEVLFAYPPYQIVKLPAEARLQLRVSIDPDNVAVMHGQRRFVLGIYDTSGHSHTPAFYEKRFAQISQAPLNLYINYWHPGASIKSLWALLTALHARDLFYLHTVNTWYPQHHRWPGAVACRGQTADALGPVNFTACMAEVLGAHPALAGWYTADERAADDIERVFAQYKVLRTHDPGGLTFIAQNRAAELLRWRDTADVFDLHAYPIFNTPEGHFSPLQRVFQSTKAALTAVENSRPVWTVIQMFQHGARGHFPTYDELRTMSWMAIVAGAKGLLYWSYGAKGISWVPDPQLRESYWQRLVRVTREIKSLEIVLLAPDVELIIHDSSGGAIRTLVKPAPDQGWMLFACNTTPTPTSVTWTLAEPARQTWTLGPQPVAGPPVQDGRLTDRFGPYEVKMYAIR